MTTRPGRVAGLLVLASTLALAPAASGAKKPGAKMETDKAWREAETTAVAFAKGKWQGEPTQVVRNKRVPFLVDVDFKTGGETVLVRGGKVVEARGLEALSGVLRDLGLPKGAADLKAEDLTKLVILMQALPPTEGIANTLFVASGPENKKLLPSLSRKGGAAQYRLSYLLRPASTANLPKVGAPQRPGLLNVSEWTLTITADKPAAWTEARYRWDAKAQKRLD